MTDYVCLSYCPVGAINIGLEKAEFEVVDNAE
jgi:hypothetical protein